MARRPSLRPIHTHTHARKPSRRKHGTVAPRFKSSLMSDHSQNTNSTVVETQLFIQNKPKPQAKSAESMEPLARDAATEMARIAHARSAAFCPSASRYNNRTVSGGAELHAPIAYPSEINYGAKVDTNVRRKRFTSLHLFHLFSVLLYLGRIKKLPS